MRGTTYGAPVFLCGMMGSGKSTVGRELADRWGCPFVDLDQRVERIFGQTVSQIFDAHGEAGFRERESLALRTLLDEPAFAARPTVVATGGGIVLREAHREAIRIAGAGVFLDVPLPELVRRLTAPTARAQRPLLGDESGLRARLDGVWSARAALYQSMAFRVAGDGSPQDVAVRVALALDPGGQTGETADVGPTPDPS